MWITSFFQTLASMIMVLVFSRTKVARKSGELSSEKETDECILLANGTFLRGVLDIYLEA